MRILGISAFYHDSAAALIDDGEIIAAAQEERFSRVKHDSRFPRGAAAFCIGQSSGPIDAIVYYEKPLLKFSRILSTAVAIAPRGFRSFAAAIPDWVHHKLWLPTIIEDELRSLKVDRVPVYFSSHHESHAASAFYPSPFERAAILTLDGVGEWTTTTLGRGSGSKIELMSELRFPHSLGLLYSAFTHYCGFRVNSGEYKLMGLAPHGEPRFASLIRDRLVRLADDGSFQLNLQYFGFLQGQAMTNAAFEQLFGAPARRPNEPITAHTCDLARSIQAVAEEIVLRLAHTLHSRTHEENLCLAGGVALNCVANGRLLREGPFKQIWVQPAAGDAGGAVGAALAFFYRDGAARPADGKNDRMRGAFLGPQFSDEQIETELRAHGLPAERLGRAEWIERIAAQLIAGDVVGLFQGRAEFGPRALGGRSILADARSREMQRRLNLKIKFRESFRPFAPIVLAEEALRWFDCSQASPYMLFTAPVAAAHRLPFVPATSLEERINQPRSTIPAVTHVDYSARFQTVAASENPVLHSILETFFTQTGCPVLVNTSFNVRGEPPVGHPREAIECFLATNMDCLAIGSFFVQKNTLPPAIAALASANRTFAPD
jgi:carbamoyltransferase